MCIIIASPIGSVALLTSTQLQYVTNFFPLVDTDECTLDLDNCSEDATCTNTEGSYTCTCNDGYTGDGTSCTGEGSFHARVKAKRSHYQIMHLLVDNFLKLHVTHTYVQFNFWGQRSLCLLCQQFLKTRLLARRK